VAPGRAAEGCSGPQPPAWVLIRGHAGLVINKLSQVQLDDSRRVQTSLREMAERSQRLAESLETRDVEREREVSAMRADLAESRDRADMLASSLEDAHELRDEIEDLRASLANAVAEKYDTEMRLALARGAEEGLEKGLREAREALSLERQRHARAWAAAAADRQAAEEKKEAVDRQEAEEAGTIQRRREELERAEKGDLEREREVSAMRADLAESRDRADMLASSLEDARLREGGAGLGWVVKVESVDAGVQVDASSLGLLENTAACSRPNGDIATATAASVDTCNHCGKQGVSHPNAAAAAADAEDAEKTVKIGKDEEEEDDEMEDGWMRRRMTDEDDDEEEDAARSSRARNLMEEEDEEILPAEGFLDFITQAASTLHNTP